MGQQQARAISVIATEYRRSEAVLLGKIGGFLVAKAGEHLTAPLYLEGQRQAIRGDRYQLIRLLDAVGKGESGKAQHFVRLLQRLALLDRALDRGVTGKNRQHQHQTEHHGDHQLDKTDTSLPGGDAQHKGGNPAFSSTRLAPETRSSCHSIATTKLSL